MGVPGFYSWLARRYPLILHQIKKGEVPNIDCFYLDMNGIIYKCSKDEGTVFKDLLLQRNIQEIFSMIFNYIDEMVNLVEPKKVLYLFLDGPCPRAKQNQQRTRRFQSAQSWKDLNDSLRNCGFLSEGETMKNNSISTGTEFMHDLNKQLHFYICKKFEQDPRWSNLEVFFSGSNVPGEGEHKIINFMHQYCSSQDYDPTTTHCIYGADADLIMLGLSTHIKYVSILREEMKFQPPVSRAAKRDRESVTFQMIYLNIVREYMELEYKMLWKKVKKLEFNIERVIDDFLLICCFIGNDFLPRLYCFNIREGQFEILIQIYKDYLVEADSYLNDNGHINWVGLQQIIQRIAEVELDFIGDKATDITKEYKRRIKHQSDKDQEIGDDEVPGVKKGNDKKNSSSEGENDEDDEDFEDEDDDDYDDDICDDNDEKDQEKNDQKNQVTFQQNFEKNLQEKKKEEDKIIKKEKDFINDLQENYKKDQFLGKSYYYQQKLNLDFKNFDDIKTLDLLITKYLEGLQFVLLYYYQGCPSWSWYFPFYYAPMTSDISLFLNYKAEHLSQEIVFDLSEPYPPMKQLMCIIHPENANLLPKPFAQLLTDPNSKLRSPVDYYPDKFTIDPYGGVFSHEYIVVLPFMDQKLIDDVYSSIDQVKTLTPQERERNQFGKNIKYKFDHNFAPITIQSTLPNYYKDFQVTLKVETFDIGKVYSPPTNPQGEALSRFPTLHAKQVIGCEIDKVEKGLQMKIRVKSDLTEADIVNKVRGKPKYDAYCKYPNCEKVQVTGFLTESTFKNIWKNKNLSILENLDYSEDSHHSFYLKIKDELSQTFYKKGGIIYNHSNPVIAILLKYTEGRRTLKGTIIENSDKYEEMFCPLDLLMKEQKIEKVIQVTKCDNIEKEFPIGCKVVIAQKGNLDGHTGIVTGYTKGKLAQELLVQLKTKPVYLTDNQLKFYSKDDEAFITLKFLSFKLQLSQDVLLDILDSFSIKIEPNLPSANKLPKMLDVGLNIIRRHLNEVVPELARINEASQNISGREKYQQFRELELSPSLVKLIIEYYNAYPKIFAFVAKLSQLRKKDKNANFYSGQIWSKEGQDPNIELVKLYIWLMKKKESQFCSSTVASKVMHSQKIEQLVKFQDEFVQTKLNIPQKDQTIHQIDANNAIPAVYSSKQYIYFKDQPFYHEVGDQVIYIGTYNTKNAPFGLQGTIVGIMDDKFEVVFIKPFIGGVNLGGRCPPQRGLVVQFDEIYNLQGWNNFLQNRDNSKENTLGWNGWVDEYKPQFREAIKSDKDLQNKQANNETQKLIGEIMHQPEANLKSETSDKPKTNVIAVIKKQTNGSKGTDTISEVTQEQASAQIAQQQQQGKVTIGPAPTTVPQKTEQKQQTQSTSPSKTETQKKPQKETVIYVKKSEVSQQQQVEQKQPSTQITQQEEKKESESVKQEKVEESQQQQIVQEAALQAQEVQIVKSDQIEVPKEDNSNQNENIQDVSEIEKLLQEQKQFQEEEQKHQILDVSEIEKQQTDVQEFEIPKECNLEEIEKQMLQDQFEHIKHQDQKDPEMLDVAKFEKEQMELAQKEAKGQNQESNKFQDDDKDDTQKLSRKQKKLKNKDITGFNPGQSAVQFKNREQVNQEKRMKRNEKRLMIQEQNLQYQQYQQYYQYLYLWQQQFIKQKTQEMEAFKRRQEEERINKSLAQLTNPVTEGESVNQDLINIQNALEQQNSKNSNLPQDIQMVDSSQIEQKLSENIIPQVPLTTIQQGNVRNEIVGNLTAEDLENFEELERQYLSSLNK
ncbi:XRN 5'-3' exonuclease amine-terminal protein (macronuclear) [Tetrahymena thermophila SB210]|uniref:XRN 5'-3' exonuclease amine-terminal protein n=1 Tax=Tetrahymena thermophila (strain SB210) TaxID=312017 RepID=I7MMX2_TETTS|nr:XRN 5'-3' exonuclease amine-terminal protein [Tetrahymena thermophila SB210]EAS07144.2 XRN 5'-3' exonuclease amine-terminal protein [Tetrahymena thermophila SB210]|eukprot:XP_001027386.2 XRN 5'-3' exonuclease amine-terminal protein [Tetrahymena thermophila SB210]